MNIHLVSEAFYQTANTISTNAATISQAIKAIASQALFIATVSYNATHHVFTQFIIPATIKTAIITTTIFQFIFHVVASIPDAIAKVIAMVPPFFAKIQFIFSFIVPAIIYAHPYLAMSAVATGACLIGSVITLIAQRQLHHPDVEASA